MKLTELAKREHRSLNQQIEFLLERSLKERPVEKPGSAGTKTAG
jgi:hypothetical protein